MNYPQIPENYWDPKGEGIRLKCPWMVPSAVFWLHEHFKQLEYESMLEVGSGSSTLFFEQYVDKIFTIENNAIWYKQLSELINQAKTLLMLYDTQESIENCIKNESGTYDIISIDSVHGYNRDSFLKLAVGKMRPRGLVILDNWGDPPLFPITCKMDHKTLLHYLGFDLEKSRVIDFHDPRWCGYGTRIVIKG